jgi:hypothetical protein
VLFSLTSATPSCGEELAPLTCDKTTILSTFYNDVGEENSKVKLAKAITTYEGAGFTLNDCGKVSDNEYRLHWYRKDDGGSEFYETTDIID